MSSKNTKAKRRNIPTFTIAELEDAGRLPLYSYLTDALDKWLEQERAAGTKMAQTSIDLFVEQLPDAAKWWVKSLSPAARTEIDRLLRETGVENFALHWREHKADLEEAEKSFNSSV